MNTIRLFGLIFTNTNKNIITYKFKNRYVYVYKRYTSMQINLYLCQNILLWLKKKQIQIQQQLF